MATLGIIPRYPPLKGGWYAPWDPFGQVVGIIPPFPPPPPGAGGQEAFAPVFFTAADETMSIFWPNKETIPQFQVFVFNELTGEPEVGGTALYADESYPDTVKYTYQNAGAYGYISITGVIEVSKLTVLQSEGNTPPPPPPDTPVSVSGSPSLPDATVDVAYNYSILINGTQPITLSGITAPTWMTIEINGGLVTISGTPTSTATGETVEFTIDNDFGDPVTFTDTIDVGDVPPPPPSGTKFGANIDSDTLSTSDKVRVIKELLQMDYYRGARELLAQYTGQGSQTYNACKAQGVKMLLNANWGIPPNTQFCHDEALYKSKLNLLLNNYGGDLSVIEMIVIENEPDNLAYYNDTMDNYIRQLGWAVEVCNAHEIPVADGCNHIVGIIADSGRANQIMTGINNLRISGKAVDYVNWHTNLSAPAAASRKIIEASAILRARTGINDVISNEWHIETNDPTLLVQAVADCRTAGVLFSLAYGGVCPWTDPKKAYPLNCGMSLTNVGTAFKNAVFSLP